jgi:hypothetical protein
MISRLTVLLTLMLGLLSMPCHGQQPDARKPKGLPQPAVTIKDGKQFNAVRLGPGNTISVVETPPDFQLSEFAISCDGRLLAMGWASGRIELWDLNTKRRVSEFKSGLGAPQILQFNSTGNQLVVTGPHGRIAFLGLPRGERLRAWRIPLGKYHYDIQVVVLDPQGKWMAYADEESSKVLDLTSNPPRMVADLTDAGCLALSQDGSELWTVDRSELKRFSTASWQETGHWPLKTPPLTTSSVVVRAGVGPNGERSVAVPSGRGLVIYREPQMVGELVTQEPTSRVAFARASNTYVDLSRVTTFLNAAGSRLCTRSYRGSSGYTFSEDGQWFALSQFDSVELWRMGDLLRDCVAAP